MSSSIGELFEKSKCDLKGEVRVLPARAGTGMKVAMVAYAFYEGNFRIERYAQALVEQGYIVDVVSLGNRKQPSYSVENGVNIYRIQRRMQFDEGIFGYAWRLLLFLFRASLLLARHHWKSPYKMIHVHSVPDFLVFATLIPKLTGASIILDIHDILPEFYTTKAKAGKNSILFKLLVLAERMSISYSDYVIVANPIWKERLISRSAAPEKLTAIGNYPSSEIFFRRPRKRSDGKFIMTYPGSLNWHQGVDIAVRAFAKITNEIPDAEFHIYGEGTERKNIEKLVRELKVDDKVKIAQFVSAEDVAAIMADSDLAVVPKRANSFFGTEAASTKIMEFMAVGVPVVVSRTKIDSLYHSDATVKFYDADDPDELAKAILLLYRDPVLRNRLAENALTYTKEFTWTEKKREYLQIVEGLARRKNGVRKIDKEFV